MNTRLSYVHGTYRSFFDGLFEDSIADSQPSRERVNFLFAQMELATNFYVSNDWAIYLKAKVGVLLEDPNQFVAAPGIGFFYRKNGRQNDKTPVSSPETPTI